MCRETGPCGPLAVSYWIVPARYGRVSSRFWDVQFNRSVSAWPPTSPSRRTSAAVDGSITTPPDNFSAGDQHDGTDAPGNFGGCA